MASYLQELRMYNPEYLDRPYLVVLNKIDKPEAIDRLPTLTEEMWKIGCERISSEPDTSSGVAESISVDESQNSELSSGLSAKDKVKELEEYPRPLAVVGVSVLKGIKVNEMLKAIRAALRESRNAAIVRFLSGEMQNLSSYSSKIMRLYVCTASLWDLYVGQPSHAANYIAAVVCEYSLRPTVILFAQLFSLIF
ncbi:hypothetical protein RND71_027446 [Anisodus tanguticus]|uniref:OBG-type G domain-containing protein n=1 Tax=Anisodus tanguticus TaxID=243964 RepID=A0AAE1RHV2_9SOLA|nr:hypothetical protein RND71_027446 [Anisodus tanguticus]